MRRINHVPVGLKINCMFCYGVWFKEGGCICLWRCQYLFYFSLAIVQLFINVSMQRSRDGNRCEII